MYTCSDAKWYLDELDPLMQVWDDEIVDELNGLQMIAGYVITADCWFNRVTDPHPGFVKKPRNGGAFAAFPLFHIKIRKETPKGKKLAPEEEGFIYVTEDFMPPIQLVLNVMAEHNCIYDRDNDDDFPLVLRERDPDKNIYQTLLSLFGHCIFYCSDVAMLEFQARWNKRKADWIFRLETTMVRDTYFMCNICLLFRMACAV